MRAGGVVYLQSVEVRIARIVAQLKLLHGIDN